MLVELGLLEQRHKAVLEVLNGAEVTEVARRYGVARQTLHDWLRRYARNGMAALSDRSSKPGTCRNRWPPRWRPASTPCAVSTGLGTPDHPPRLAKEISPVPSRSAVYRALVRHSLIEPTKRRRQRGDYKHWEPQRWDLVAPAMPRRQKCSKDSDVSLTLLTTQRHL